MSLVPFILPLLRMSSEGGREGTWRVPVSAKEDILHSPSNFHFSGGDSTSLCHRRKFIGRERASEEKENCPSLGPIV